jgi:Tol biopolymer transport system component
VVKISDTGYRADWSPSGDRIAATDDVTGAGILDAATGKKLRALNPSPYFPIWSPDGMKIAAIQNARTNEIYLYDPETGEGKLAVEFPKDFNAAFKACWTADGKSLIISRQDLRSHIVLLENFR